MGTERDSDGFYDLKCDIRSSLSVAQGVQILQGRPKCNSPDLLSDNGTLRSDIISPKTLFLGRIKVRLEMPFVKSILGNCSYYSAVAILVGCRVMVRLWNFVLQEVLLEVPCGEGTLTLNCWSV